MIEKIPGFTDILTSYRRVRYFAHKTPVLTSGYINRLTGAEIFFKCENFQKVGAFKFRGAINTILQLPNDKRSNGVATHSSGNHAQALALAARMNGIQAHIVMPENAPVVKAEAVKNYGALVYYCQPTLEDREKTLREVVDQTGAWVIHPYNDYNVIAGQATASYELLLDSGYLDAIIAPVGGGGLLSGTCLATHYLFPGTQVYGAEPRGASDAFQSLIKGEIIPSIHPVTIADGLLTSLGDKTYPILKAHVKEILLADDQEIIQAMKLIWERMKIIVEPSAAVPLAVLMKYGEYFKRKKTGIILSGGNLDISRLPFSKNEKS